MSQNGKSSASGRNGLRFRAPSDLCSNELPHPEVGRWRHGGAPWRSLETPIGVRKAAPCMGEDNEYVVMELLGRSPEEYERLVAMRVVERQPS